MESNMKIWALADLHLAISTPEKNMEAFGNPWNNYMERIKTNWEKQIREEDLILIPGDICWATKLSEAHADLHWIDALPGTKVILKGNHDYWWPSAKKLREALPPSIHFIYNNVFNWHGVSIGGARLWDTPEYRFDEIITEVKNPFKQAKTEQEKEREEALSPKLFERELNRLKISLSQLDKSARLRIAMTHYPPIGIELRDSRASKIFETYNVNISIFGHLHNIKKDLSLFGEKNGVLYLLTSADYLTFDPIMLTSI